MKWKRRGEGWDAEVAAPFRLEILCLDYYSYRFVLHNDKARTETRGKHPCETPGGAKRAAKRAYDRARLSWMREETSPHKGER